MQSESPFHSTLVRLGTALAFVLLLLAGASSSAQSTSIAGHAVVRDAQQKIVTWMTPADTAFDRFLHQRWNFIKTGVPMSPGPAPRSSYPQYYFFNGYGTTSSGIEPDWWMNDVGEKIPNWFENARLYYAYTGDASVMQIAGGLVDYALAHGTSPSTYSWPNFPYTTTNAGDTEFRGFTEGGRFLLHEIQVDHAAEMGLTYYRMYLYTGDAKYLTAARNVADVLASKARTGTATQSVWPYRVVMSTGTIRAQYGANWIGAYTLLDVLSRAGIGNVAAYQSARDKARAFILGFPMVTGYWTDGHSDTPVDSNTYRSNLSKSNTALYMLDNPDFDPDWRTHIPQMIQWTETYFVNRTTGGEPATDWGANIVGEQDSFNYKMDYQTARYAAENAKWYAASGDAAAREKAFRSLSWVTYTNDSNGRATESPYSLNIATWWSDCYGEGPRMFYHAFAAIPEWAPPGEDHILYSQGVLRNVSYAAGEVRYTPTETDDVEYLRLTFAPSSVTVGGFALSEVPELGAEGYTIRSLGGGDYAVNIRRTRSGAVVVASGPTALPAPTGLSAAPGNGLVALTWNANAATGLAGYNLYRSTTSPVSTSGSPLNGGTPLIATSYTNPGLVNGTTYFYAVTAVGTAGNESAPSAEASATPEASAASALAFDGTNDLVTFGAAAGLGVSEFTVEVWFKKTGPGVGVTTDATQGIPSAVPLVTKGRVEAEGSSRDLNFFLGIGVANGVLAADFEDAATGANHPVYGTTAVTPDVWHHAAATYDGGTWRLYLDGNLDASLTLAGSPTPRNDSIQHAGLATAMTSAGVPGAAGYFRGLLDEARIWNSARSLEEVRATMNLEIPSGYGGLVARWGLDEGSGLVASDSSGGISGTLTNGPVWVTGRSFTPDVLPPAAPQNLAATAGNALASLTWTASTEPDLAGYNVYRDGARVNGPLVTTAAYVDTGLTNGQTYAYTVTAVDFGGLESDPSDEASATPATPVQRYTLTVTAPANGTIAGSGIACGTGGSDCTETYDSGTVVPLAATPASGYTFGGWTGACTGTGACSVTMTAARTVGATFAVVGTPTGLVAAYGFEEGSGTTTSDASGLGHTGTIAAGTWSTAGRFGRALSFNGSSTLVTINDTAALRLTSGMTLEAWVRPTVRASWRSALMKETSGGLAYGLYASNTSSRPTGFVRIGSSRVDTTAPSSITRNAWTHIAATYDGATFRLFVNGTQVRSRAITGSIASSTQPLRIGGNQVSGEYFAGLIDEVRVYNRALSAAEIQADMNAPVGSSADTTAPVISSVSASVGGSSTATVQWATSEPATSVVRYGTAAGSLTQTVSDPLLLTAHGLSLTGLTASTTYYYQVTSVDAAGNSASSAVGTFATTAASTPQTLTVTTPTNGTIAGTGIACGTGGSDCTETYAYGTVVPLAATPGSGYTFGGWTGACTGTGACSVTMTAARTVGATFAVVADTTAPTVAVTAPAPGSTVSGTVTVSATASDNVAVAGVQFLLDGALLGAEDATSPYSVAWNTATATAGSHTLTARARDAAGNQTTSAAVSVTVTAVVSTGLVAAYGFEEGSGTTTSDASGLGHTGTIAAGTWSTAGRFGRALSFNGTSSLVTINDAAALRLTSAMTLEAWVRPTASASWRTAVLKETSGGLAYGLYASDASSRPGGFLRIGSDVDATAPSAIALNAWTHLAATYDGATLRLFVNGTQVASRALTGSIVSSTQPLRIGGNQVWGEYFAGLIDEVRVYNRALSAAEIQADMNAPVSP